jgi:geranylgeranylglycerol-phosphate geranylgeranyltransferase
MEMMRLPNSVMVGIAVIVGEIVSIRGYPSSSNIIFGFLTGFFISISSMILNDYFDVSVDKINSPDRPIPSGRVSKRNALGLGVVVGLLGIFSSLFLTQLNIIIAILFWAIAILYDWKGKKIGILGNSMVSMSVAIPYIFGAAALSKTLDPVILTFFCMSFLANLGREITKDILDVEGDKTIDAKTLAITRGPRFASLISGLLLILAILLSPIPLFFDFGIIYIILILIANSMIGYAAITQLRKSGETQSLKIKKVILLGMLMGLFSFLIGSLYT